MVAATGRARSPTYSLLPPAAAAGIAVLIYLLWRKPVFLFDEPHVWMVLAALAAIVVLRRRLPLLMWLYTLYGFLTIFWSLAPGHTLLAGMWEILFLAAFAAGSWRPALWILNVALLLFGLERSLLLYAFHLQQYLSGSVLYVAGAQALVLVPPAFRRCLQGRTALERRGSLLLLLLGTYLAVISGARAVYLPLIIIWLLMMARALRERASWKRLAVVVTAILLGMTLLDVALPGAPARTALRKKASIEVQQAAVGDQGVLSNRLRLWDQTLAIALGNPFGAGLGSYPAVVYAYQKYPMTWSNSPHNVFVETVAAGGWLRLLLLLLLLIAAFLRGWGGRDWPYALSLSALWLTMAFDVTSYYPSMMMLAFLLLGTTSMGGREKTVAIPLEGRRLGILTGITVLAGLMMVGWWFLPCQGNACLTERYLGYQRKVLPVLADLAPQERWEVIARLRRLYPKSLWVLRSAASYAEDPDSRLLIAREIAERFPYQHPDNYLRWAERARDAGLPREAISALERGLRVFPADSYPYAERNMTPERYAAWLERAQELLAELRGEVGNELMSNAR